MALPTTATLHNKKGSGINYDPSKTRTIEIVIDSTATDSGSTVSTTLRAGLTMSQIMATGHAKFRKWLPSDATTQAGGGNGGIGLSTCKGVLAHDVDMLPAGGGAAVDQIATLITHARILEADLKVDHGMGTPLTKAQAISDLDEGLGILAAAAPGNNTWDRGGAGVVRTGEAEITFVAGATILGS